MRRREADGETARGWEAFTHWAHSPEPSLRATCDALDLSYGTVKRWKHRHLWEVRRTMWLEDLAQLEAQKQKETESMVETLDRVRDEALARCEAARQRSQDLEQVARLATMRARQLLEGQLAGDPSAMKQSAAGVSQLLTSAMRCTEGLLNAAAMSEDLRGITDELGDMLEDQQAKAGPGQAGSWRT